MKALGDPARQFADKMEAEMKKIAAVLIALFMLGSSVAYAHSGGTDRNGCHHDRVNGGYHCH